VTGKELKKWMEETSLNHVGLAHSLGVTLPTVYKMLASDQLTKMQALAVQKLMDKETTK
jgi:plasmid maintenance system antidote protein VapI